MRTSTYRFLKKGSRELVRALLDAGFDGDQRNGTGHIKFTHPITKMMIVVPVNLNPNSILPKKIHERIEQSNRLLKEMKDERK